MLTLSSCLVVVSIRAPRVEQQFTRRDAEGFLLLLLVAPLVWWNARCKKAAEREVQLAFEAKRQSAADWLAEKKQFRALDADPQAWEDWLDKGQKLAISLKQPGSFKEDQLAALEQMHTAVVNDIRVYESARAIVAMQTGSRRLPDSTNSA